MRATTIAVALAAVLALALMAAGPALASEQIKSFGTVASTNQAGGHPDLETSFALEDPGEPEAARNITFSAPQGVFGNTNAITQCTPADFALQQCPSNSQAGLITIHANYEGTPDMLLGTAPMFVMLPEPGETARFSFIVPILNLPIAMPVSVRTGSDYGLNFKVADITQNIPVAGAKLIFWGVPGEASHNAVRFPKGAPGEPAGCPGLEDASCNHQPTPLSLPPNPLTDNPTHCTGQTLVTRLEVQTYQDPGHPTTAESSYPAVEGCEKVTFKPLLEASPTTENTDSASGLNLILSATQFEGFAASPSQIKSAVVTLPPGLTVNPDAADGQTDCPDALANFGTEGPAECPDGAKIGSFAIGSPTLNGDLIGSVYIGEPKPGDQYRLFLIASGFGMNVKIVTSIKPDPSTGQLTAYFEDLPQVPFETFQMHLFAGERALMATPINCGFYSVSADFFPWDEAIPDQRSVQNFPLEAGPHQSGCPGLIRPFNPRLVAGTSNPNAGAFSKFTLKLERDDGDQFLGDLNFKMPPGFTGDLRGIGYCPEADIARAIQNTGRAEQASGSCPASSQIGTTNVAAGPGSHPFHAVGRMYLSGPFQGAPLSLVAITPALAGPYDYGTVVIRVALHVDPLTAQVSAVSETVPQIIGGIPIRMRSIQVNIDRENFTINPTNCGPLSVDSQGIGDQGTVTDFSSYFNAVNCATLAFKPKMTVRQVGGRKGTHRGANPALQFDLRTRPGDANIKSMTVTLPSAFEIDQEHLGNLCTEKELAEAHCAGRQQIGEATTTTPLLDQPLSGPVYAVSGSGGLPRLAFLLNGQVSLVPRAETKTAAGGRLATTVPVVPDAPIGHFHLVVFGGKHGYLSNTHDLCHHSSVVKIAYSAQSGASRSESVKVKAPCGGAKHRPKRHKR